MVLETIDIYCNVCRLCWERRLIERDNKRIP